MARGILRVHPSTCDWIGCQVFLPLDHDCLVEQHPAYQSYSFVQGEHPSLDGDWTDGKQKEYVWHSDWNHRSLLDAKPHQFKGQSGLEEEVQSHFCRHRLESLQEKTEKDQTWEPANLGEIMTPREHFRKMSVLNEQGALDDKQHHHLYQLANGLGAGGPQDIRHRQEMLMRNQMMVMNPHSQIIGSGQQRLQALPSQFEPRFLERELLPSSEMLPSADARQMHLSSQLGPPVQTHTNTLPNCAYPGAGYSFLQPNAMDSLTRRQELIHKQNLARLEMNALLQQKELENAHRKGLLGMEAPLIYSGISANPITFHNRHRLPEGHLASEAFLHRNTLDDINAGNSLLITSNPYPPISTLHRDRSRRGGRRAASQKSVDSNLNNPKGQLESKSTELPTEPMEKEAGDEYDSKMDTSAKPNQTKMGTSSSLPPVPNKNHKEQELRKHKGSNEGCLEAANCNPACGTTEKDLPNNCAAFDDKFMFPSTMPLPTLPYGFQLSTNQFMPLGSHGMFVPGEEISIEDIRKWSIEDVYNFINILPGCSEYAQTFKDHAIDGETLPLLTEEHLLDIMGLKLGPALKIRSQVSRRIGNALYVMNLPISVPLQNAVSKPIDQSSDPMSPLNSSGGIDLPASPCTQDQEDLKLAETSTAGKTEHPSEANL
ncbi:sterile alpha motif domain-containing protein 7 isoform X1 [Callorhinchus milii]|uniref:sterile alpha motif domain-containing protein 7 isoform X1 n=1 Tax=Callorhinchus milii TaxID=7868 RepID=UPI001C3FF4BF|nr:sterile alpha motif domain-containing protein 7 isoform X1 [Callorhinchus milii]